MTFSRYRLLFLTTVIVLSLGTNVPVFAQHEGHDMSKMPGMSKAKPKPKPKAKAKSKRKLPARKRKGVTRGKQAAKTHTHTPGMNMPASSPSPNPQASPLQTHTHTPGMNMPASSPSPNPPASLQQTHTHTPGMNMPASSPSPNPAGSLQQTHTHTPPTASPSAGESHPQGHPPGAPGHTGHVEANTANKAPADDSMKDMPGMAPMNMGPLMVVDGDTMSVRVGSSETNVMPMGQMGSVTSWAPISTQTPMIHKQSGDWLLMFHYNAVVGVNSQGGPRGVTKAESANWFMPMAFHKLGKGTLQLRGMFSLEPFTFPPGGSPLLFQTGETYKGRPIIDAQHPHDLFMELSAQYTHPLGERGTWFAYFGYPGEPALGPTAFMHRASASENSAAVLSHHLQDSSHITFGVLTTGFTYRWFKLEGSVFNGREPDENRYNFEAHKWNSRSARLSFAPNNNWTMQISHGLLRNPEALEPGDVRRTTASISYNRPFQRGSWATSLIWGRNHENHGGEIFNLNGYVAESTVNFRDRNYLYTRLELVDKNALLRDGDRARLGITDHHASFRIGAYNFGGARDIWTRPKLSIAIGSDLTFYSKPAILAPIYGGNPVSWKVYLRFRPGKMDMASMHGTH
jgi:hypothetical protein